MTNAVVALSDEELRAALIAEETETRRRVAYRHALVAEVGARGLAQAAGVRSTATYLNQLLHLGQAEAGRRVRAAADLGPRRGLTGESLEPIYPLAAQALADGVITERHAAVIVHAVEKLPDTIRAEHEDQVEADLVGFAERFDPRSVEKLVSGSWPTSTPTVSCATRTTGTPDGTSPRTAVPTGP